MRIAYLVTSFDFGGAEMQVFMLAREMHRRYHDVAVVHLVDDFNDLVPELVENEITSFSVGLNQHWLFPKALYRARAWGKEWRPDVVHSHMVHANIFGRFLRLVLDVPVVISTAHNEIDGGQLRMWAYRATDRLTDLTTNVSPEAVEAFITKRACPAMRIRYVANGVDVQRFKPDLEVQARLRRELNISDRFLFLAVGNLYAAKDYPTLIKAFAQVHSMRRDALLLIAGEGPHRQGIEALIRSLSLDHAIRLLGTRRDISDLMNAADCFVMSSVYEGAPMVLIEAMSCGKHIICTEFGGAASLLGNTGVIVPSRNPALLAAAMLRTTNRQQDLNQHARSRAETLFCIENVANTWETIYRKICCCLLDSDC